LFVDAMKLITRFGPLALALVLFLSVSLPAQLRVQPVAEHSDAAALSLAIRKLKTIATFMETTAHPDDEDNALLAMLGHGQGMRTVLVTATRGDGGQNEIGPELSDALGVLRTEELLAVHRFDGAEQYFTRAIDFGYSFSVEESLQRWGREEILGDFVRHIRTIRPDVIAGFLCGGAGGGQHHQASALLTREAFRDAGDPSKYPEQFAEGLRPWQAKRVFCTDMGSFGERPAALKPSQLRTVTDVFEPQLGRTYGELGIEARSMHKCQGTSQLLPLPGASTARTYLLQDSVIGEPGIAPKTFFEGIDTSLAGLAIYAGPSPSARTALTAALARIGDRIESAERASHAGDRGAATRALAEGLAEVRALREGLEGLDLSRDGRFEVDFRLRQKEHQFERAVVIGSGLRVEALADDGLVTVGQPVKISVLSRNNSATDVRVDSVRLSGFDGTASDCRTVLAPGASASCESKVRVGEAPLSGPYWKARTDAARYDFEPGVPFGVPFRPSPFMAILDVTIANVPVRLERTVEFRYDSIVAGEKRMELKVVPPFAVTLSTDIAIIPRGAATTNGDRGTTAGPFDRLRAGPFDGLRAGRRIDVSVIGHAKNGSSATVSLQVPSGWQVQPAKGTVEFTREDEARTTAFYITPPARLEPGDFVVRASADGSVDGVPKPSSAGYDVIEYPHTHRRHLVRAADAKVRVIDVTIAPNLVVGYIMGVGDQVPPAIEQLGATVRLIDREELSSGDLSKYDVIMTGVRAYERRADLRANNHRLLDFVSAGGTLLVQYNKFEFNQAQYGPYPAKVGSDRVTDENAAVNVLVPDHPVFTTPNRIGPESWAGWVQERGLYFLGDRDPRYVDLVRSSDPFEYNAGPKTGALVEARYGKGRWIYVGLGLWRQLPAGTPGAYRLLANLLSLGHAR
jgi:LmbE family N-acetylglucosaminyl deacetylase